MKNRLQQQIKFPVFSLLSLMIMMHMYRVYVYVSIIIIICIYLDEHEKIQKKTFTKWVQSHLRKATGRVPPLEDLYTDLRDGCVLLMVGAWTTDIVCQEM